MDPRLLRPLVATVVSWAEAFVGRRVDVAIATQPLVCARLGRRCVLVENAPLTTGRMIERARAGAERIRPDPDIFRLIYVGLVSAVRGLFTMLEALTIANRSARCRLWLIGPGPRDELSRAQGHPGWTYVDYAGPRAQAEAFAHIIRSDVGLATLHDAGDHRSSSPNKLFEYLVFSVPFIASDFPSWRERFGDVEAGFFVPPGMVQPLAETMVWCARHRAECARRGRAGEAFVTLYNWEAESRKLLQVYSRILADPAQPASESRHLERLTSSKR